MNAGVCEERFTLVPPDLPPFPGCARHTLPSITVTPVCLICGCEILLLSPQYSALHSFLLLYPSLLHLQPLVEAHWPFGACPPVNLRGSTRFIKLRLENKVNFRSRPSLWML